jgi:hypothetical protein
MNLEKNYRLQLQEVLSQEPVNNMGKWAKQTKIDSINEKIEWIENVKDIALGDFDFGSGLDKDSWIAGYIVGFATAADGLRMKEEIEGEGSDEQIETDLENQLNEE